MKIFLRQVQFGKILLGVVYLNVSVTCIVLKGIPDTNLTRENPTLIHVSDEKPSFVSLSNCTILNLTLNEYRINGGKLITNYSNNKFNISKDVYFSGNNATLCFPKTPTFINCVKWRLEPFEYSVLDNRSLLYKLQPKYYTLGSYSVSSDNYAYICSPFKFPFEIIDMIFISVDTFSFILLLFSFISYVVCPFRRHDSKALICHMAFQLLVYVMHIVFQLIPSGGNNSCYLLFLYDFTVITALSWLNVMSYDLWQKLCPRKNSSRIKINQMRAFAFRCVYSLSMAFFFAIIGVILQFYGIFQISCLKYPVLFGCKAHPFYLFMCCCLINIINLTFLVIVLRTLKTAKTEIAQINIEINKNLISVYIKLMFVYIVIYGVFAIQFIFRAPYIWILPQSMYTLLGVFIFLIYGCKSLVMMFRQCWKVSIFGLAVNFLCNRMK